jgi:hypothetical protein
VLRNKDWAANPGPSAQAWIIRAFGPTEDHTLHQCYLSGGDANDARGVLAAFASRWEEVSAYMLRGEEHPTVKIGTPENQRCLGDLLRRRAKIFREWSNDDEMWE